MTVRIRSGRFMIDIRHCHADGRVERFRLAVPDHLQTRRGASRYEQQVRADLRVGLDPRRPPKEDPDEEPDPTPKAPTLADYAPLYLAEQVARGLKPSSLKSKRGIMKRWILPLLGRRPIDQIRTRDFTKLRMALVEAGRKPKTTNNCLTGLSAMVKWWHAEHDLAVPQYRVNAVKQPKGQHAAFYEFEPFARLVQAADRRGSEDLVLVLLGGRAGLRMSEIRALHWSDCDLGQRPQLVVQRTREDDEELPPKGWRTRVVPMIPDLASALRALPRHLYDPHVLLHEGRPLTRKQVRMRFNRVQRAAGLPETGFHITRHTFCSHLAMQAVPASAIQALAGHADLSTTQRYMHLAPSALDDASAALTSTLDHPPRGSEILAANRTAGPETPTAKPAFGHSLGTTGAPKNENGPVGYLRSRFLVEERGLEPVQDRLCVDQMATQGRIARAWNDGENPWLGSAAEARRAPGFFVGFTRSWQLCGNAAR